MTSFIAACGSGRSTSVIPAVPAAWSVTTIAFIVIVSSAICFFPVVIAARDYLFQYAASILSITAETLLRRSLLPFAHRGALRDLPYLDRNGRSRDCCDHQYPPLRIDDAQASFAKLWNVYGVGIGQIGRACARCGRAPGYDHARASFVGVHALAAARSEEHTSELQSLMRISYAVFCLKKNKNIHK